MVCANATDTHNIPLLLIGKSKNPHCFKNVKIPLTYKNQKNEWMNADLFMEWFQHTFVPEVKQFQQNTEKEGKVLLLLDNAPSHSSTETLNAINDEFEAKFFPPNVLSFYKKINLKDCCYMLVKAWKCVQSWKGHGIRYWSKPRIPKMWN